MKWANKKQNLSQMKKEFTKKMINKIKNQRPLLIKNLRIKNQFHPRPIYQKIKNNQILLLIKKEKTIKLLWILKRVRTKVWMDPQAKNLQIDN